MHEYMIFINMRNMTKVGGGGEGDGWAGSGGADGWTGGWWWRGWMDTQCHHFLGSNPTHIFFLF
jgi:hypothetical protein